MIKDEFTKIREKDLERMVDALAECFEHFESLQECVARLELNNARGHIAAGLKLTRNWRQKSRLWLEANGDEE